MKKIVKGNDFRMLIPVRKRVNGEDVKFPLPACTDIEVNLINAFRRFPLTFEIDVEDDSLLIAKVNGESLSLGKYALEVKGKILESAWRSNEYEQICLVDNNASGDTEFGETVEGESSVEMDTAYVILPPQEDLRQLVADAESVIGDVQQKENLINTNERERVSAEELRVSAENERESAENERGVSEQERQEAEQARDESERERVDAEEHRINAENVRADAEQARATAENNRVDNEEQRVNDEDLRKSAESLRADSENVRISNESERKEQESLRVTSESARVSNEDKRVEQEDLRKTQEAERMANESMRVTSEQKRANAEQVREYTMANLKAEVATATQKAEQAADSVNQAITNAQEATQNAENVNATIEGSSIVVTDRTGTKKSIDVVNTDEKVSVTIASNTSSVSVSGIKISVYLNNGKTPQVYTTDVEGRASFIVARGNYYEIIFPEYGNVKPISPIGYTALLAERDINVVYENYKEEDTEKVVVKVKRYSDDDGTPWAGMSVVLTMDGKSTTYTTDDNGVIDTFVPLGKTYTVSVEDTDGYHVNLGRNKRTYTANMTERQLEYRMYPYKLGIQIIDVNGKDYYLEEWKDANKSSSEAVAVKMSTIELYKAKATFMLRVSDLVNPANVPNKSWCTSNVLFSNIATNGNNKDDALYYKGQESSFLIRQEAIERSLITPAFDYVDNETLSIGGQTLNGFILSAGQMLLLVANADAVKQVIATLYGDESADACYKLIRTTYKWTSTQGSATYAYGCTSALYSNYKSHSLAALPAFAC